MTSNPFERGSAEASAWRLGYLAARADDEKRSIRGGTSIRQCPHGYVDKARCRFCNHESQGPLSDG